MGRPPTKIDTTQLRRLYEQEQRSVREIARMLGTSRETVRQRLHAAAVLVRPPTNPGSRSR